MVLVPAGAFQLEQAINLRRGRLAARWCSPSLSIRVPASSLRIVAVVDAGARPPAARDGCFARDNCASRNRWELWLAPLKPAARGWRSRCRSSPVARAVRARQDASLAMDTLLLPGISRKARGFSESGRHALCAFPAAALSLATVASGLAYVRLAKLKLRWRRTGASE
jgi:hypothetical protein